jgi:VIT1/CCC1 family predicted Fe2+/Mn2+ transporter
MEHEHTTAAVRARINAPYTTSHFKDIVYGGIDGAVTTFALVAGVQGAGLSQKIIIVLGIANVLADGFSMAASNYSGTKTELDDIARLKEIERRHIREIPDGEREEVRQILQLKGLKGQTLEQAVLDITKDENAWVDLMLVDEYGKSPIDPNPLKSALYTFGAFFVAGFIPLIPFLLATPNPFNMSAIATATAFLGVGIFKSKWSPHPWWRSGFETLFIGCTAAAIAYGAGYLVSLISA